MYVPKTRADLGIPPAGDDEGFDWDEYFGDTPAYTLFMLVRQQLFAFEAYLSACRRLSSFLFGCVCVWKLTRGYSLQRLGTEALSEVDEPL